MLLSRGFLTTTICLVALAAGTTNAFGQTADEAAAKLEQMLVKLNERVLVEYVLHNNTGPLEATTRNDFVLVGPAGVEPREQVVATVGNLDVDSVTVENTHIRLYGSPAVSSAVLTGTLRAKGTLGNRSMPVLSYLSVFVREGDEWQLAARSLTPLTVGPPDR